MTSAGDGRTRRSRAASASSAAGSSPRRWFRPAPSSRPRSVRRGPTPTFRAELDGLLRDYAGRPSLLTECARLGGELGLRLLLKREDLNHTGSHKINNVLGQALLAQRMGKARLVAETGAGQHGVATATAAALLGLECVVYMGEVDMRRQALNVFRMRLLGAEVRPATTGSRTLKDAVNEAMRDWVATVETTHYCLGSVMGPHPYPWMVRELHRVIGDEAREQCRELHRRVTPTSSSPASAAARTRPASSPGSPSCPTSSSSASSRRAARRSATACPASCTGRSRSSCRTSSGRCWRPTRCRPGSTTRASGPSTRTSPPSGRARYESVTDAEVLDAFQLLSRTEGIIPALEPAHALAWVLRSAPAAGRARSCW